MNIEQRNKKASKEQSSSNQAIHSSKQAGIAQRTNIKVGSSLGDFWTKLKGVFPS